jgi:predicted Zn-dependent protease with MMP-like domain
MAILLVLGTFENSFGCRYGESMVQVSEDEFEQLVSAALDSLPNDMMEPLDNIIFLVENTPEDGSAILGEYDGYSLAERENYGFGEQPDRVILYRDNLQEISENIEELRREIRITLVHEIAHFYGISEERIHELGWG